MCRRSHQGVINILDRSAKYLLKCAGKGLHRTVVICQHENLEIRIHVCSRSCCGRYRWTEPCRIRRRPPARPRGLRGRRLRRRARDVAPARGGGQHRGPVLPGRDVRARRGHAAGRRDRGQLVPARGLGRSRQGAVQPRSRPSPGARRREGRRGGREVGREVGGRRLAAGRVLLRPAPDPGCGRREGRSRGSGLDAQGRGGGPRRRPVRSRHDAPPGSGRGQKPRGRRTLAAGRRRADPPRGDLRPRHGQPGPGSRGEFTRGVGKDPRRGRARLRPGAVRPRRRLRHRFGRAREERGRGRDRGSARPPSRALPAPSTTSVICTSTGLASSRTRARPPSGTGWPPSRALRTRSTPSVTCTQRAAASIATSSAPSS